MALGVPGTLLSRFRGQTPDDVLTFKVKRGTLAVVVKEKGSLESSNNQDVLNEVEGQTTIISILPEGTRVTKGQLVCELDSAALTDNLSNQKIATERAKADFENASKTHEVAVIAVEEYLKGIFPQDLEGMEGDITLAQSTLSRAKDRLEWSSRMAEKKYIAQAQLMADQSSLLNAEISLKNASRRKLTLEEYTKAKEVKTRQADVEKALSDKLAKQATLDLETQKEKKLVKQIDKCKLIAPNDGLVVYANETNRFGGTAQPLIEEGATVRERQKIFSLPDITHMRVNTKVHESMVDKIAPGLWSRVKVDAFPGVAIEGKVAEVKPLPDPPSMFSSDIKVYTTLVSIDKGPLGLRPGMNAQVEILVKQLDGVLAVPIQSILQFQGKNHVYAIPGEGKAARREVMLGISNDKLIEVREGIKDGELVALNPAALMTEEEKREVFGGSGKDAAKSKGWAPGAGKGAAAAAGPPPVVPSGAADGAPAGVPKAKGRRGGMANLPPEIIEKFQNATPEEKGKMIEAYRQANPGMIPPGGAGGNPGIGPGGPGGPPQ